MCIAFYIIFAYVCRGKTTKPSIVISLIIIILFLEHTNVVNLHNSRQGIFVNTLLTSP